jgi:hypothetical protein
MKGRENWVQTLGLIVLVAAFAGACEKSEVLAPTDATIVLTAIPNPVGFSAGVTSKTVVLEARLRTADGFPQQGVTVQFTTTAGTLDPDTVKTNVDSIATTELILAVTDPNSVDVKATSGGSTQTVTITKKLEGVAPSDGTLALSGPANVTIDPSNGGETQKTISVAAILKDKAGQPVANVPVSFQPTGCSVGTSPVSTDATGTATANLTVKLTDYVQCSVFAQAGALTATTTIAKSVANAPGGATVDVQANPPAIDIKTSQGATSGNTAVTATVTDVNGLAIPGITVVFNTNAGNLGTTSVATDNQGRATVTLTMTVNDPAEALVQATANPVSGSTTIAKHET